MNTRVSLVLFLAVLHGEATALSIEKAISQQLVRSKPAGEPGHDNDIPVVRVENALREHKQRLMTTIERFRAKVCYTMKQDYGIDFETFEACHKFMDQTCKPGKDGEMDGEKQEVSSGKGYCKEYFPKAKKEAEEEVAKQEAEEAAQVPGPVPGPAPAPAPGPAAEAADKASAPAPAGKAEAKAAKGPAAAGSAGSAPAPGPAGSPGPGPAPVPAPFIPGISAGKPYGKIAKDEAYYFKKDGKDPSRLHMSEDKGLPTQGYWGKLVEHEDQKTFTGDWMAEFGPKASHSSVDSICNEHPETPWCMRRGYGSHLRSSSPAMLAPILSVGIATLALFVF